MYDPRKILQQEPVAVSAAVKTIVLVAVVFGWIDWSGEQTATVLVALETVLTLFYVRPGSTSTAKLEALVDSVGPATAAKVTKGEGGQGAIATLCWFLLAIVLVIVLARFLGVA